MAEKSKPQTPSREEMAAWIAEGGQVHLLGGGVIRNAVELERAFPSEERLVLSVPELPGGSDVQEASVVESGNGEFTPNADPDRTSVGGGQSAFGPQPTGAAAEDAADTAKPAPKAKK